LQRSKHKVFASARAAACTCIWGGGFREHTRTKMGSCRYTSCCSAETPGRAHTRAGRCRKSSTISPTSRESLIVSRGPAGRGHSSRCQGRAASCQNQLRQAPAEVIIVLLLAERCRGRQGMGMRHLESFQAWQSCSATCGSV